MADQDNHDGIVEILQSLQQDNENSATLFPTSIFNVNDNNQVLFPEPEVDLQLSLGGFYSENHSSYSKSQEPMSMMKRSYLEQNNMVKNIEEEEIKIIRDIQMLTRSKNRKDKECSSSHVEHSNEGISFAPINTPFWAAQSASRNPAFQRALEIIKSEGEYPHNSRSINMEFRTSKNPHANRGFGPKQYQLVNQALQENSSSIVSSANYRGRTNVELTLPSKELAKEKSTFLFNVPLTLKRVPFQSVGMQMATLSSTVRGNSVNPPEPESQNPLKRARIVPDSEIELLSQMPTVLARGNNPNGEVIEGILYKYGGDGDPIIVCICHGHFFSPQDFVKHAGGGDVEHPFKHISIGRDCKQP